MRSVRVLKNVLTNYARFFLGGVLGILLTPIMVHLLGDRDYGLWVTVFSLTGYFGLFDQGIRPSLVRYVARDHARGDRDGLQRTINTALALFGAVGVIALVITAIMATNFPRWFHIDPAAAPLITRVVWIAGASVALGFPLGVFGAALSGLQRYDLSNGIGIAIAIARALAFVVVLRLGGGLEALAWCSLAMSLAGHALSWMFAHRLLPGIRYGLRYVTREHLRLIGSYSSIAFVGALASSLTFQTDALVITAMLGAALVTPFAIAAGLVENVRSLVYSATYVLAPTASELDARGETDKLHEMLVAGAKFSVLLSWPVLFGLLIFGPNFLATWVGERYRSAFPLLLTLTVPTLLSLPQATAGALLYGVSRHRGVVTLSLANALLNLGLSIALARPLGLLGVALGTALPLALIAGLATMIYACRALGMRFATYLGQGLVRPGLVTAAFAVPALALRATWNPMGWVPIAAACAACWTVFAVCAWRYGVTAAERDRWRRMVLGLVGRAPAAVPVAEPAAPGGARAPEPRRPGREIRVSVLLTAYNAAWCIERALDSVFAQTRLPDEVIVSDDGSTDDTVARVERKYGDRVRVLRLPHRGLTPSRRASFAAATGDWCAVLDADDWWQPMKLERQIEFITRHPELRWIGTDGEYVAAEGVVRPSWLSDYFDPVRDLVGDLLPRLVERCFPLVSSMLIERGAYEASGGFDPAFAYSQDYDLWLRLAARHPGAVIAEPLIAYWSSPGQLSRRIEARYLDDLALMQRIARGDLRRDATLQRRGRERAAALEFDLALLCLRTGRGAEARERFGRATAVGSWRRRLMAVAGATLPARVLTALGRLPWLGRAASAARRSVTPATDAATSGGAA